MGSAWRAAASPTKPRRCTCSCVGWHTRRRGPAAAAAARSADLGRAGAWSRGAWSGADLGRAAAAATFDAAAASARAGCRVTSPTTWSGRLGRHRSAARAGLGGASRRGASGSGTAAPSSTAACAAATGRTAATGATGADLGVASCRVGAGSRFARALLGCCATRRARAQHLVDRLGHACGQRSARSPAGAVVE